MALFSIITPSFQQGAFIERTLRSVVEQTFTDWEYIICDAQSTDETGQILTHYCHHPQVTFLQERDRGQADAVNKGILRTRGAIIGWLNSDDCYLPETLERVAQVFLAHPQVQVVYGDADYVDAGDRPLEPYPTAPWSYDRLKESCFLCQPAVFFRRDLVHRYGLLNPDLHYCLDYELWLRFGQHTDFYYLQEKLATSRMHGDNKTLGQRAIAHYETNQMLKRRLGYVPDPWLLRYARVAVEPMTPDRHMAQLHNRPFPIVQWAVTAAFIRTTLWAYWHWQKVPNPHRVLAMVAPKARRWWFTPPASSAPQPSEFQTPN
jgi:glycosyltransferase involved in cell wall biosynthesis